MAKKATEEVVETPEVAEEVVTETPVEEAVEATEAPIEEVKEEALPEEAPAPEVKPVLLINGKRILLTSRKENGDYVLKDEVGVTYTMSVTEYEALK